MPKRNRHKELKRSGQIVVDPVRSPIDDDVARFAAGVKAQEAAERKQRAEAAEAMRRANRHDELRAAKADAVAELKAARARGDRDRTAAAEATYRAALADLQEFETGERPTWAPAQPDPEPADADSDSTAADPSEEDSADATDDTDATDAADAD